MSKNSSQDTRIETNNLPFLSIPFSILYSYLKFLIL